MDGSPPCSTFSLSGNREKDWGKEKVFREGQTAQVLDTLFFDFIALAKALQPKVVIAENVKGLLMGNAIDYVRRIYKDFEDDLVKHFFHKYGNFRPVKVLLNALEEYCENNDIKNASLTTFKTSAVERINEK